MKVTQLILITSLLYSCHSGQKVSGNAYAKVSETPITAAPFDSTTYNINCRSSEFLIRPESYKIDSFMEDVIYNLNWPEEICLNCTGGSPFWELLICLVENSNNEDPSSKILLHRFLTQIVSIVPKFKKSDFLELSFFYENILFEIRNEEFLNYLVSFAKINAHPKDYFDADYLDPWGESIIHHIVSMQKDSTLSLKYNKLHYKYENEDYKDYHKILLKHLMEDIAAGQISDMFLKLRL